MPEFDPNALPPQPDVIPDELRSLAVDNTSDWSVRVPAAGVGMFVAAVVQWLSHPRFGVRVNVETSDRGWLLRIDLPDVEARDDVVLDMQGGP